MLHVVRSNDLSARRAASGFPYLDAIGPKHGATRVYAAVVRVPAGAETVPHYHKSVETVIFQLRGRVKTYHGPDLADVVETGPGDFIFIPPGHVHQGVNESGEDAEAIVFRDHEVEEVVEVPVRRPKAATSPPAP